MIEKKSAIDAINPTPTSSTDYDTPSSGICVPQPALPSWTKKFHQWRARHIPDYVFLMWLAAIVGIVMGFSAYLFKALTAWIAGFFKPHIEADSFNWWIIITALAGIMLTGIFTRYVVRTNLEHGCGQLIKALKNKCYRLKRNIAISPMLGGAITLGLGGSAGAEGPIAFAGAAMGSNIGQALGLSPRMLKILIACGAGAGIAGIFIAPAGGMLFTLEVLRVELSTISVLALALACLTSYLTIYTCHGFAFDLPLNPGAEFDTAFIPLVIGLGLFCGLYSIYYTYICHHLDIFFGRISNPWIRNLTGGLMLGLIVAMFPSLYGTGYGVIESVVNGDLGACATGSIFTITELTPDSMLWTAVTILLAKSWVLTSTNSSGGVGGDFAPTLFAGCMGGLVYTILCTSLTGYQLPAGMFAYIAMAGCMAGIIQAPMMAIFIVLEMSGSYQMALPVAICAAVSYFTVRCGAWTVGLKHRLITHRGWFGALR